MPLYLTSPHYTTTTVHAGPDYDYVYLGPNSLMSNSLFATTLELTGVADYRSTLIEGTILAARGLGIEIGNFAGSSADVTDSTMRISETGSIQSHYEAVSSKSTRFFFLNEGTVQSTTVTAIRSEGSNAQIVNTGTVGTYSLTLKAISVLGIGSRITNHGDVFGGIELYQSQYARLENSGEISGATVVNGIGLGSDIVNNGNMVASADALAVQGNEVNIKNHGTVTATNGAITIFSGTNVQIANTGEMYGESRGILGFGGTGFFLDNSGTLTGLGVAISTLGSSTADTYAIINNTGQIIGDISLATSGLTTSDDRIVNTGTIVGDIDLGVANDSYFGASGTVEGTVDGGDGDDTLVGGREDNVIDGGSGNDNIRGGAGDDTLSGEGNNDTVHGGAGNDEIDGGDGDDDLRGGQGDDEIDGGANHDTLNGGLGDDILIGGAGNDTIRGGAGDDVIDGAGWRDRIVGGTGNDVLTGGTGPDTFVFGAHHGNNAITDFQNGSDQIDISAFGLTAGDFAAVVAPALTAVGGNTLLEFSGLGGSGSVLIEGLALGDADASDFVF